MFKIKKIELKLDLVGIVFRTHPGEREYKIVAIEKGDRVRIAYVQSGTGKVIISGTILKIKDVLNNFLKEIFVEIKDLEYVSKELRDYAVQNKNNN